LETIKQQRNNRAKNPNGKLELVTKSHATGLNVRQAYWDLIKKSPYSASKLVDIALTNYFKDQFKMRLENSLNQLYEDALMLEMLKDKGKMGLTKFTDKHLLQIESYREAIRILENSPLMPE
jgi:hypothetical protein